MVLKSLGTVVVVLELLETPLNVQFERGEIPSGQTTFETVN